MKHRTWRIKLPVNILDNIIIIVLKYCKDKFILKGEVYESYNSKKIAISQQYNRCTSSVYRRRVWKAAGIEGHKTLEERYETSVMIL